MANLQQNITCIITSVIGFQDKPLSYAAQRSVFSPEKRAKQTLRSILSVRDSLPNARIVLIEGGLATAVPSEIKSAVDEYVYVGEMSHVRMCVRSKFKGLGEVAMLLAGINRMTKLKRSITRICKLSGRYYLDRHFDPTIISEPFEFMFKKYSSPDQVSTRFYALRVDAYSAWKKALLFSIPGLLLSRSIEQLLYERLANKDIKYVKHLGVSGLVGPDGALLHE